MIKIAVVVWIVLGTALAGCALLTVLSIDVLASQGMKLIPMAVLGGFLAAMPLSYMIAQKIDDHVKA
jgi:outer membrane lipoprotein SlyB